MKRKTYSKAEITAALKKIESGQTIEAVSKETGISTSSLYIWRDKVNGKINGTSAEVKKLRTEVQHWRQVAGEQARTIFMLQSKKV